MKIAVNTRFLLKDKLEGIGWFTYETMKRITRNHPEHQFYFFFDRTFSDEFIFSDNIEPLVLHPQSRHPVLWYLWFEIAVPKALKKIDADLFVSTDGFLSLSAKTKTALVIHDIAFEHYPEHLSFLTRKYLQYYSPQFAKRADRIATVSEFSKNDIATQYGIPKDMIDVVYNGANEAYHPYPQGDVNAVKQKHNLTGAYFIYAGSIHPRKNIDKVLLAFEEFKQQTQSDVQFVIAGRKAWKYRETMDIYEKMQFKEDVRFLGHLDTDDLSKLISGALAMVYVSKFEGFGIPILEAMQCETPVITSNNSSMPEVAGDAAILVNPESVMEIARALEKVCDEETRLSLITKGKIQKEKFSWDQTTSFLWSSIAKAL